MRREHTRLYLTVGAALLFASSCAAPREVLPADPVERGKLLMDQGRVKDAIIALEQGLDGDPQRVRLLALAHTRRGDYGAAAELWGRVTRHNPTDGDAWRRLGDVQYALGSYARALLAYEQAVGNGVQDAGVVVRMAEANILLKRPKQALDWLERNAVKYPRSAPLQMARGRALAALNQPHKAIKALRVAASLDDKNAAPYTEMGTIYEALDFPARAAKAYKKALALQPEHVDTLVRMGRVLIQTGQVIDAIPILTRAARVAPDSIAVLNNLGVAFSAAGMYDDAVTTFQKAIKISGSEPALHSNAAESLYRVGRLEESEKHLRKSLSLTPTRLLDHAALRKVVLMRVVLAERCRAGKTPTPKDLEAALISRWNKEGWPPGSHRGELADLLEDREAMHLLDKAISACPAQG